MCAFYYVLDLFLCYINVHAHIQYEEFLRILHPEFEDDELSLADFKSNVTDSTRVRGAKWNVDYQAADAAKYVEVEPSPKNAKKDVLKKAISKSKMKTLTLDAFSRRKSANNVNAEESKQAKEQLIQQRIEIKNLKEENEKLKKKLEEVEKSRDDIRSKYDEAMTESLEKQKNDMSNIKKQWEQQQNDKIEFERKLKQREEQNHEKDVLIANLNQLLDKRNTEIEELKKELMIKNKDNRNLETMLQHAIDSKMKSLVQSQSEIQKLKMMLSGSSQTVPIGKSSMLSPNGIGYNSASSSISNGKKKNNNNSNSKSKPQKARHLSHLIGD